MDPFSAIGLVSNIITFLDFSYKLITTAKYIQSSASGASKHNDDLSFMTSQLQRLATNLKVARPEGSLSKREHSLLQVATQCEGVSIELATLLDKLRARNPKSNRESIRAAIRDWRKKDQKADLEQKLDCCRQQLNLELLSFTRSELLERLHELDVKGQASIDELQSLRRNTESLRLSSNVSCLSTEALDQIRSLLQGADSAIWKIRQNRVLRALRFELMNERFEDIEKAHETTFEWIFDEDDASVSDRSAFSEENSSTSDGGKIQGSENLSGYVKGDNRSQTSSPQPLEYGLKDSSDDSSFEWYPSDDDNEPIAEYGRTSRNDQPSPMPNNKTFTEPIESPRDSRSQSPTPPCTPPDAEELPRLSMEFVSKTRDNFINWLKQGSGIFHISGKPGSGKSTLMKYLTRHPKTKSHLRIWSSGKKLALGTFFFWKPGSPLQKNVKGLIRGLLYYLLAGCPDLVPLAFPVQWEAALHTDNVYIEHTACQSVFEKLISADQTYGEYRFVLFIDGLDEFEGNHAGLIRHLFKWAERPDVKLCVSSREWAIFQDAFQDCPKLRLHNLTISDIRCFVTDRFREMRLDTFISDKPDRSKLKEKIIKESDGVFLWVSLILRHIEDGLINGDQVEDLMRLVSSLPTELEPMLRQLLDSIPHNNRKLAYSMLSLAHFCAPYDNQVFLMQYSFLEEYVEDNNFAMGSTVKLYTRKENIARLERAKRRIYGVCKGFLELRRTDIPDEYSEVLGYAVHTIHRSIVEFLESEYFRQRMDLELFDPFDAYCQTYLSQLKCVRLPRDYFTGIRRAASYSRQGPMWVPYIRRTEQMIFQYPYNTPSFMRDVELRIQQHITFSRQGAGAGAASRFYEFLDSTYHTIVQLQTHIVAQSELETNGMIGRVRFDTEDYIVLASAQLGFFEYLLRRYYIDPRFVDCCFASCLFSFRHVEDDGLSTQRRAFRTLEVLLDRGASPDSSVIPDQIAFHIALRDFRVHPPQLSIIAFMLFHGVNPRFSIVISKSKYRRLNNPEFVFKAYQKSTRLISGPKHEVKETQSRIFPSLALVISASPRTFDMIKEHGRIIDLRTLVSIWFPDQSPLLRQVMDYILELGVPTTNVHQRSQLQFQFGRHLRPLFDPDHPAYVGSVRPRNDWPYGETFYVAKGSVHRYKPISRRRGTVVLGSD
ncbi:hypothetical protein GGS26DRAFT_552389 [Hypomontagnella submonticulosa]|nr:hypothetical protein GGS26DRAFT_552389 [Hypomontagnella submonticulosa]